MNNVAATAVGQAEVTHIRVEVAHIHIRGVEHASVTGPVPLGSAELVATPRAAGHASVTSRGSGERSRPIDATVTSALPLACGKHAAANDSAVNTHVLIVDNDPSAQQLITDYLSNNGIRVTAVASGREIAQVMNRETIDLLILELYMPGEDGMRLVRRLREEYEIPIIVLSWRGDEVDRVMGLELGADDYLTKPFSPRELLARIRALLRRSRVHETIPDGLAKVRAYRFSGWELNVRLRRLTTPGGEIVALTNCEFNLLAAFLAAPQRVLSRDQLLNLSRLHNDEVYDRAIDVQVRRLRKKLELDATRPPLIRTERGAGYLFTALVEAVRQ